MICYLNPAVAEDVDAGKSRSLPRLDVSGFDSRLGASVVRVAARVRGCIRRVMSAEIRFSQTVAASFHGGWIQITKSYPTRRVRISGRSIFPMTPVEQAKSVYEKEPCVRSFKEDLTLHLINGYVFSTPEYFIMGRAVCASSPYELILDPDHAFPREVQDCWHIYLAAGVNAYAQFFRIEPYELPLYCWEKRNRLRFYKRGDILRKFQRFSVDPETPSVA